MTLRSRWPNLVPTRDRVVDSRDAGRAGCCHRSTSAVDRRRSAIPFDKSNHATSTTTTIALLLPLASAPLSQWRRQVDGRRRAIGTSAFALTRAPKRSQISGDMGDRPAGLQREPHTARHQLVGVLLRSWHEPGVPLPRDESLVSRSPSNPACLNPHLPGIPPARPPPCRTFLRSKPLTPNCAHQQHNCRDFIGEKSKGSRRPIPIPTHHGPDPRPLSAPQNPDQIRTNKSGRPDLNRGPHRPELWAKFGSRLEKPCKSRRCGSAPPRCGASHIAVDSRGLGSEIELLPNRADVDLEARSRDQRERRNVRRPHSTEVALVEATSRRDRQRDPRGARYPNATPRGLDAHRAANAAGSGRTS